MKNQAKTKRLLITLSLLAAVVLLPAVTAPAATISADQEDYAPGEIVTLTGAGFAIGSEITLTIKWPEGSGVVDDVYWGFFDDSGTLTWTSPTCPSDWFDGWALDSGGFVLRTWKEKVEGLFTVRATDEGEPPNEATTTFTDAPSNFEYNPTTKALTVVAGNSTSFTQYVTAPKNNGSFTASLKVASTGTTPIPETWVSASPTSLSFITTPSAGDTESWSVIFTVPSTASAGDYTAQIKAVPSITGVGQGAGTAVTLSVTQAQQNRPPVGEAGGPYSVHRGGTIQLDGSASFDPDGDTISYAWDLHYDGTTFDVESTDQKPTFDASGMAYGASQTVALCVTDSHGAPSALDNAVVTVRANVAPEITEVTVVPTTINENDVVTLTVAFSPDPGEHTATINWGEGEPQKLDLPAGEYSFTVPHQYLDDNPTETLSDQYKIAVTVTDDGPASGSGSTSVTVNNVPPSLSGVPVDLGTIDENGSVTLSGTVVDPGTQDTFTLTVDWGEGSPVPVTVKDDRTFSATHQYLDDNPSGTPSDTYSIAVKVTDDDTGGGTTGASVTVDNVPPTLSNVHVTSPINENDTATLTGTISDPGTQDTFTVVVNWGEGEPQELKLPAGATSFSATHQYLDDNPSGTPSDTYSIAVKVTDDDTGSDDAAASVTVDNVKPVITGWTSVPLEPMIVNSTATVALAFTDVGTLDSHTCMISWDDETSSSASVTESGGSGSCTGTHQYTAAGVYTISATVTDDDTGSATSTCDTLLVVYDPRGGFVTGGGWINSPAGAYIANPSLVGKANFGFVSKYQKGASAPDGNTEFQFKAGDLNFHSSSYQWLVVAGAKAQYKGVGTINGSGNYGFLLTATDGQIAGGGVDKFRIKIWDKTAGDTVVYDNAPSASDDIDKVNPQAIASGSIVIHK